MHRAIVSCIFAQPKLIRQRVVEIWRHFHCAGVQAGGSFFGPLHRRPLQALREPLDKLLQLLRRQLFGGCFDFGKRAHGAQDNIGRAERARVGAFAMPACTSRSRSIFSRGGPAASAIRQAGKPADRTGWKACVPGCCRFAAAEKIGRGGDSQR